MPYRFKRGQSIDTEVRRIVREQIDRAVGEIDDGDLDRHETVHQVSKRCKKVRAVLRVVDPDNTERTVDYGEYGRVELTTLTKEFFMPRFLERDEAIRRLPHLRYPWDGVGDVRPFGFMENKIIEGVY